MLQDGAVHVDNESDVLTESDHADSHGMKRPVDVREVICRLLSLTV